MLERRLDAIQKLPDSVSAQTVLAMHGEDLDQLADCAAGPPELYDWILANIVRRIERPLRAGPRHRANRRTVGEARVRTKS